MSDQLEPETINPCVAYRDVGNEREQGCDSVTRDRRLDLDHFKSQIHSPRLIQGLLTTMGNKICS